MTINARDQVAEQNTWDLIPLFPNLEAWDKTHSEIELSIEDLASFIGKLSDSAQVMHSAITKYLELARKLENLYVYAQLRSDEDTTAGDNLGRLQRASGLHTKFSSAASFLTPEILSLNDDLIKTYLNHSTLQPFRRMLEEIIRFKPYTLGKSEENLLALGGEIFSTSRKIFSQLNNADLEFGTIEIDGDRRPLTHGTFINFLKQPNRDIREKAFTQYYQTFESHRHTIAATLESSVRKDVFIARARGYASCLDRSLFADNIETIVYDNLCDEVSRNLEPLHRYYQLRSKLMKIAPLRIFDTYLPLVSDVKIEHSFKQAVDSICQSLEPLGDDYVTQIKEGLTTARWVDRYENKGKRSGAYSSGSYDSPPYILMNFKETELNDVYTLTHEAGHSMHSFYSNKHQPYQDHGYTIFVAEVASTFNEQLLNRALEQRFTDNPKALLFLINHQIDEIKSTFYRQVMFAEYEKQIHQIAEQDLALTIDTFRQEYRILLAKYFGPSLEFGELDDLEGLRIPHFYSAFYVYKYATGIAAAIALSEDLFSNQQTARSRYLNFLSSGGSKHPLELLREAGVDLTGPQPILAVIKRFEWLVQRFESLVEQCLN